MKLSNNIIIGKYVPGNSFLHSLNARAKIIFVFLYILLIFLADNLTNYISLSLILGICIIATNIKIIYFIKGLRPVLWIVILTILFHLLLTSGGEIVFQWNIIEIHSEGIEQAILISLKILFLISTAILLTLTTSPIDLAIGLEHLLSPLKYFKVPTNEIALILSISIRFIPIIFEETDRIIKAQRARGAYIGSGKISNRIKSVISIIIPLFTNTFKRADDLANAMEARCYRGGKDRTRLNNLVLTLKDYIFLIIVLVVFILMIIL